MRRPHDRGGWSTDEPIDPRDHIMADWERRTHALVGALREKGMMNTDELRRGIEALPAATYESLSYYERWASAIESLLVEQRVLTVEEIDERVRTVDRRWG